MNGARAAGHRLLILLPSLDVGGAETRFLTLAEAVHAAGGQVTLLAEPGPLTERAARCSDLRLVRWRRLSQPEISRIVMEAARGHTAAVMSLERWLFSAAPAVASVVPLVLCLNTLPSSDRLGFGYLAGRRVPRVVQTLLDTGRVALVAVSALQARDHARMLGVAPKAVPVSPNGVHVPTGANDVSTGPIASVAVVARLRKGKLCNVVAAADLVAAGRALGQRVTLDVYGGGSAERLARHLIARRLPADAVRIHGSTATPLTAMRAADVLVGTGRANVEALMLGRRVVAAKSLRDPRGQLGPAITPATFDAAADDNFSWRTGDPYDASAVWTELAALSAADVTAVRDRARRELSAAAMLERELAIIDGFDARPAPNDKLLEDLRRELEGGLFRGHRPPRPLIIADRAIVRLRPQSPLRW